MCQVCARSKVSGMRPTGHSCRVQTLLEVRRQSVPATINHPAAVYNAAGSKLEIISVCKPSRLRAARRPRSTNPEVPRANE